MGASKIQTLELTLIYRIPSLWFRDGGTRMGYSKTQILEPGSDRENHEIRLKNVHELLSIVNSFFSISEMETHDTVLFHVSAHVSIIPLRRIDAANCNESHQSKHGYIPNCISPKLGNIKTQF